MIANILSNLQWLHIFVATFSFFALGAVWYSPILFSKRWVADHKIIINHDAKKGIAQIFVLSFVCMFIATTCLAICQFYIGNVTAVSGFKVGLMFGICFNALGISINYLYLKKPLSLFLIDGGYQAIGLALAGTILGAWH